MFHRFPGYERPTLGVELELQVLDAETMAFAGAAEELLAHAPPEYRDSIKPEFYDCCVEVATGVCRDVDEVGRDLLPKLAALGNSAARLGLLLGWGGTHPFSHWKDRHVFPTPRYHQLAERYRDTLMRQLTFGLHVHVQVRDCEAAVRTCNGLMEHLPTLLALSVNSPFWCGRATGLHSNRVQIMDASPSAGLPPRFSCWEEYAHLVEHFESSGLIESPKELWWDVRPSAEHGTVEVRVFDMPGDLPSVQTLAALAQCLVVAESRDRRPALDECGVAIVKQNRWRAARSGMDAEFVDPRTGSGVTAREAVDRLVSRLGRTAEEFGCGTWLRRASSMALGATGARRQLDVFERTGDLSRVVRSCVSPEVCGGVDGVGDGGLYSQAPALDVVPAR